MEKMSVASPSGQGGDLSQQQRRVTRYSVVKVAGKGSFGTVYKAEEQGTGRVVAVKKVYQDKMYKNRELSIMRKLQHPNIVALYNSFYSEADQGNEYLNLVMEYIPDNINKMNTQYMKNGMLIPMIYVKIYAYQMFRGLAYLHSWGFCHRDIKPQNVLINPQNHAIKLCDFGSAKRLSPTEPNVSYICSRYYRAPELIFGATNYTVSVDLWSTACVLAELLKGTPLFHGDNNVNQLVEIIKVLGTPTREQIFQMNASYQDFKFPVLEKKEWKDVFPKRQLDSACVDVLNMLFLYEPNKRVTAVQVLQHPFFDEIKSLKTLPDGKPLPPGLLDTIPDEFVTKTG